MSAVMELWGCAPLISDLSQAAWVIGLAIWPVQGETSHGMS